MTQLILVAEVDTTRGKSHSHETGTIIGETSVCGVRLREGIE